MKKVCSLFLALIFVLTIIPLASAEAATMDFDDVNEGDWFYDDVSFAHDKGVVSGTSEKSFSPDMTISRGMFVTIMGRVAEKLEVTISGDKSFDDVVSGSYYEPYVRWAASSGIVDGYSSTKFAPEDPVTREQMCKIVAKFAKELSLVLPKENDFTPVDADKISGWASDSVQDCIAAGIIQGYGDNSIRPINNATRAEGTKIIHTFLEVCEVELPDTSDESDENIELRVKNYIIFGQLGKCNAEKLLWSEDFLNQLDFDELYNEFISSGGKSDDIKGFADYITFNAPVADNWKELFEADLKSTYDAVPVRYEYLEGVLYQVYEERDGKEVPYVAVNARTGYFHG